jgi:hypothetical protein
LGEDAASTTGRNGKRTTNTRRRPGSSVKKRRNGRGRSANGRRNTTGSAEKSGKENGKRGSLTTGKQNIQDVAADGPGTTTLFFAPVILRIVGSVAVQDKGAGFQAESPQAVAARGRGLMARRTVRVPHPALPRGRIVTAGDPR